MGWNYILPHAVKPPAVQPINMLYTFRKHLDTYWVLIEKRLRSILLPQYMRFYNLRKKLVVVEL